jgi:hypothetical protein
LQNLILNFVRGGSGFDETPNERSDLYEAVVVAAIKIDDHGFTIDGLMRDRGGIYPESLIIHSYWFT